MIAHKNIIPVMGSGVLLLSIDTKAVISAPIPNCSAPIRAEAVPALFSKGAKDKAEVLGNAKPCVLKNKNAKTIIEYISMRWKIVPKNKSAPAIT